MGKDEFLTLLGGFTNLKPDYHCSWTFHLHKEIPFSLKLNSQISVIWGPHPFTRQPGLLLILISFFFFLATPVACSSRARDQTHAVFSVCATAAATQDP